MVYKKVKEVTITFEDGTSETWGDLPPDQAYYRERYTWEEHLESKRIENKLTIREITWVLRERVSGV